MNLAQVPCRADEEDVVRLMTQYGTDIKRVCAVILGDVAQAEDAAQETFIKAWRAYPDFRGECSEKSWLFRIAINTCRDMKRSRWLRHTERRITPDELRRAYNQPLPDSEVIDAVRSLPRELCEAVLLRYYEGMSLREAADALGIGVNTLSSRLARARKRLKKSLEGWYYDE